MKNVMLKYGAVLCMALLNDLSAVAQKGMDKKNVLFVLVDDLRPNLGCYGDPIAYTPNIDRLAKQGVVFNKAYCQQAVCNPSRTSMLTGLRPDVTGVYDLRTHFRDVIPQVTTLPQVFKNNGYFTASVGKVFHNSKRTLDPVSWTEEESPFKGNTYVLPENQQVRSGKQQITEMADVPDTAYSDGQITKDALLLLDKVAKGEAPFFIAVGFKKPHAPFCAPKKYWELYDRSAFTVSDRSRPMGSPDIAFHDWQELRGYNDVPDTGDIPPEQEQQLVHGYYACISYVDEQIGQLMSKLEALGLRENTVVVLWGDHGYHLGEQELWCKSTNFELDTRVPLIIASPGMGGAGAVTGAIVESVDIFPTLNDLCGIDPKMELSGISLRPLLEDPLSRWEYPAFSQFLRPYPAIHNSHLATHMGYSVRVEGWRCTYWYDLDKNIVVERELYRLGDGSPETENVAGTDAPPQEIEKQLSELIERYRHQRNAKNR